MYHTHKRRSFPKVGSPPHLRAGAVVLETLLAIPILLIAILALVQFSMLTSRLGIVERAARDAADVATTIDPLPEVGAVPDEVIDAVAAILDEKNIEWQQIRVDHNIGPEPPYELISGTGTAIPPANLPVQNFVAVTVSVDQSQLAPNLLKTMCFDLEGRVASQFTVRSR